MRLGGASARRRFRVEKARALAALGRDEEAVALATETADALAETGRSRPAAPTRSRPTSARNGDSAQALELYERPSSSPAAPRVRPRGLRKMAELLEADGRKDEALELLKRAVAASPSRASTIDSLVC